MSAASCPKPAGSNNSSDHLSADEETSQARLAPEPRGQRQARRVNASAVARVAAEYRAGHLC